MWCIPIYRQAEVDVAMKDQLHQSSIFCELSAGALVALSLMDNQGRRKLLMGSYTGMVMICEPTPNTLNRSVLVGSVTHPLNKQVGSQSICLRI
jgi:hypothetical protein